MREILFCGKRIDNGEWVYGNYILQNDNDSKRANYLIPYIKPRNCVNMYPVDPDTVGQFTGLTDKNGKRIFEGDIVRNADGYLFSAQYPFAVKFCDGNFCGDAGGFVYISGEEFRYCEVIGSIHDNPELLEVGE